MTTIRQIDGRRVVVLRDGQERARFTKGYLASNREQAEAWVRIGGNNAPIERERVLCVGPDAEQVICWVTDAGDDTENKKFGDNSLVRVASMSNPGKQEEIVLLALELDRLAAQWCVRRAEMAKMDLTDWADRNATKVRVP